MARSSTRRKDPAKTFEDQLTKYREMRDFKITAEPRGSTTAASRGIPATEWLQSAVFTRIPTWKVSPGQ